MKKLKKKSYRGIDYINLSTLSSEQVSSIKQVLSNRTLIKILINEVVIEDCVLYFAYERWYDSVNTEAKSAITESQSEISKNTVLVPA